MMLEGIKGTRAHAFSGEDIQTIAKSLFYKRVGRMLGGKDQGEPSAYDTVRDTN